uniref:Cytochrome c biogenesis protein CcsA n=2 Tax=Vanilla TaxID=51238 RepID=A0A0D3M9W1_VANPL|nr:heme attachment to plastid cytochrome c [Vanilla planifolia]YP_009456278.1 heme attachment to plastid cytochrome c [Vanilla pompona]AID52160.1 heme attachment to plastid cytochrome c [Vanilla planifolia]AUJ22516.1 heme attachment to plastid cytochrome c [Vanilla pompona]QII90269.1 cytochrome c biogenesis protein [Vanilla planifolia]
MFIIFATLEQILTHISFSIISIVIMIHLINFSVYENQRIHNLSVKGMIATFFSITGFLIIRWISSGHFPLSNLYESLIFLSWSFSIIHMIPYFLNQKNYFSTITTPSVILTQGFSTSVLSNDMHQSAILVPALQSQWLMMHVSMMLLSYTALLCGSLLSIALLVITFRKNSGFFINMNKNNNKKKNHFRNLHKYQLIQHLDYWSYRVISLGFTSLTIGILSGALWANETWGSYWNWDPKETWAFITWTIFAIYLHIRKNTKCQGQSTNTAFVASIGFILIWVCYFGINLLGIGFHSYGSFPLIHH